MSLFSRAAAGQPGAHTTRRKCWKSQHLLRLVLYKLHKQAAGGYGVPSLLVIYTGKYYLSAFDQDWII
jgi:hypothetical protein